MKVRFTTALLTLGFVCPALATDSDLTPIDSASAQVTVSRPNTNQAANFVNGAHNQKFVEMMLKDPKSLLAKLKLEIEKLNSCDDKLQTACGTFQMQGPVLTSFARDGWPTAAAHYRYSAGFREIGSGHVFNATHILEISETVEAKDQSNPDLGTPFTKTLKIEGARDTRKDSLNFK